MECCNCLMWITDDVLEFFAALQLHSVVLELRFVVLQLHYVVLK